MRKKSSPSPPPEIFDAAPAAVVISTSTRNFMGRPSTASQPSMTLSPWAAPAIVAGLRIAFGSALVAVVPAEMLLGELGIGYLTWIEWNNLDISGVVFAILVVGVVGITLDTAFNRISKVVTYPE